MQEGTRVDANVNLHIPPDGRVAKHRLLKSKHELISIRRTCVVYETERQWGEWQATGMKWQHAKTNAWMG